MSDADDQMGGSGGETGRTPHHDPSPASREPAGDREGQEGQSGSPDRGKRAPVAPPPGDPEGEQEQSFPASDPPGNY